jgi:hypothetical protein
LFGILHITFEEQHYPFFGHKLVEGLEIISKLTRGVLHYGLAIYIKKYLKAKKIFMKIQIFHHAKI